jgi:inorganic triphosphatase YgiF
MKNKMTLSFIAALASLICSVILVQEIYAAHTDAIRDALMTARKNLVAMIDAPDQAAQDKLYADLTMASQTVDDTLRTAMSDNATAKDQAAKLKQFQEIWESFKKTRETVIVPAIRAGNKEGARSIAKGVQSERMAQMRALLGEMGSDMSAK